LSSSAIDELQRWLDRGNPKFIEGFQIIESDIFKKRAGEGPSGAGGRVAPGLDDTCHLISSLQYGQWQEIAKQYALQLGTLYVNNTEFL
jgi:hypothetical protein